MAYPTTTVSSMVSRVAHMLTNDATADSNLATEIKWALESAINTMAYRADLAAFRKEAQITATTSTRDYELPEDFFRLIDPGLKFVDSPYWTLTLYDQQDFDRIDGDWRFQNTSRPRHYTIRGRDEVSGRWILRLTPKPDQNYSMILPYFSMVSRIATAADADLLDKRFPPMFWRGVQFGAALEFPQYLTKSQKDAYEAKYAEALMELMQTANPITGRMHQNRRYISSSRWVGSTWNLTGTDLVDPDGNAI